MNINDIVADLAPIGYEMLDAREWAKHNLNRNALVKAGLRTPAGKEYGIYLFEKDLNENITFPRFKRELNDSNQSNRFIIFFKGMDSYNKFKKHLGQEELTKSEICLLPYLQGRKLLTELNHSSQFVSLCTKYESIKINDHSNTITNGFTDYILTSPEREEYYVCNYVFNNEVALYYLVKYTHDRYLKDGRKVVVFFSTTIQKITNQNLQQNFQEFYPHVQFNGL